MSENTQVRLGQPEGNRHRTLYDDGSVRVTTRFVTVDGVRYDLREMRNVRTVHGPRSPLRVNTAIAIGVVLTVIVLTARYLDTRGWIGASVVLAVPLAAWGFAAANGPRAGELWCEYRGYTVQVLWVKGNERQRYGQICRAIMRAQEQLR